MARTKPTGDTLRRVVEVIEDYPTATADLQHRLEAEELMTFGKRKGQTVARAGGLTASGQDRAGAIDNWANAARRALRSGEVK